MLALAIETSCDETSLALLRYEPKTTFIEQVLAIEEVETLIASQIDVHALYGGVVPEIGARLHAEQIHFLMRHLLSKVLSEPVSNGALSSSEIKLFEQIEEIFVTTEPGLAMALQVGKEFAKSLVSLICPNAKLYEVNHLRGHVASSFWTCRDQLPGTEVFTHLHYLVSGGNTQILNFDSWNQWSIVGKTLDDAAGESLDKIGRMVGLPYPGAPKMEKIAGGDHSNPLGFPIPMKEKAKIDVSNSGLKTFVRNFVEKQPELRFEEPLTADEIDLLIKGEDLNSKLNMIKNICISAHFVVMDQLDRKFKSAIDQYNPTTIGISGGVSASTCLRSLVASYNLPVYIPELRLTGDNATMIGVAGILEKQVHSYS